MKNSFIHSFLWVIDTPILTKGNISEYVLFIDSIITAFVPKPNEESALFNLIKIYQLHLHSKSCQKHKSEKYCYHNNFYVSTG